MAKVGSTDDMVEKEGFIKKYFILKLRYAAARVPENEAEDENEEPHLNIADVEGLEDHEDLNFDLNL